MANEKPKSQRTQRRAAAADSAKCVAAIRAGVASLCALIQEADKLGVRVDFNISRNSDGDFTVTRLDISKQL